MSQENQEKEENCVKCNWNDAKCQKEYQESSYKQNALYYKKAFKRLEETGKHTWNWSAFFFGTIWMVYRKMYLYGLGFIIASRLLLILLSIIAAVVKRWLNPDMDIDILTGITFLIFFAIERSIYGYFGNTLYYRLVKKRILKGYHKIESYRPTSFASCINYIGGLLVCLVEKIIRNSQLDDLVYIRKFEVNDKSIHEYLNPDKKFHWSVRIANFISYTLFFAFVVICTYIRIKYEHYQ